MILKTFFSLREAANKSYFLNGRAIKEHFNRFVAIFGNKYGSFIPKMWRGKERKKNVRLPVLKKLEVYVEEKKPP